MKSLYPQGVLFGYSRKKQNKGGWFGQGHGISRGTEEISWENSKVQLKKKWNFQGCCRKIHVEFPWVLVFELGILKGCHTILQNFQG